MPRAPPVRGPEALLPEHAPLLRRMVAVGEWLQAAVLAQQPIERPTLWYRTLMSQPPRSSL